MKMYEIGLSWQIFFISLKCNCNKLGKKLFLASGCYSEVLTLCLTTLFLIMPNRHYARDILHINNTTSVL